MATRLLTVTSAPSRGVRIGVAAVMKFSVAALLIVPGVAVAADPWSQADVNRQIVFTALDVADWLQTRWISTHPQFHEDVSRWAFGRHPSLGRVNTLFALGPVAGAVVTNYLPARWRPYFQYGAITLEVYCVAGNAGAGVGMTFW